MFSASALVQSLENANLSVLCTDVPDESVLLVNETLSVLLLRCLGSGLKVKGGEEEGDEGVGRSLLDFLIYRVPQHLHAQDGLSPSRKILYQKAAIANLLALLSTVSEESTKLARDLQCARDCADLVGAAVHLCLAVVIGGSMFTHKKAVEVGVIEMVVSVLEKCLGCEDSSTDSTIFDGLLCLSRLCDGNTERCQRVGPSATHVLIVLLNRLQTQLCDQECPEITDWWDAERRMGSWPPLHRLVMCAVEAVQSCVANCCEDRRLFIQNGGITVLLNIMECIPPELSQPILRCVCKIHEHENAVKTELISWQGVRQQSAMPIDESLFEKPEVNLLTQEEELVLRMNEYRIGRQHPTENNLATHLCWLWRWNEERIRRDQKYAKSPQEWSPLMKYEDLYLLIYLLLSTLNFGKHFHLEADDQITMENEVVQQIQADLRRCGVNPIIEDQDKLERAIQVSRTKVEQVMKKKMDIIKAAIACDTSQEAEFYTLPREIMRQRKAALQRDLDAQLRTSNYAYLCASRREKQRAINESRRRCQGGSCVTSTTIETSSLQCADTCSHLDDRHQMTKLDGRIESVVGLSEGNNLTGHQPASAHSLSGIKIKKSPIVFPLIHSLSHLLCLPHLIASSPERWARMKPKTSIIAHCSLLATAFLLTVILLISGLLTISLKCHSDTHKGRHCVVGLLLFSVGILATIPLVIVAVAVDLAIMGDADHARGGDEPAYTETPSKNSPSDFLSEYRSGSAFVSSLKEIHAHMQSLEESLSSTLRDYHENFRPVKPQLEGVDISADGLPVRGTPSMVHSQAVEELEALLKLHNSCQHLLRLHNGLESLGDRVIDLLRRCSLRNRGNRPGVGEEPHTDDDSDDDDDLEVEEDYLNEWKCDSPASCGNIEVEVSAIVAAIKEVESQLAVDTFYEKSEVALFQAFLRTWLDRKRLLRDFVDHYWLNMVQIHSNPKGKSTVGRLEILGTTAELQSLISLMNALHEAEKRVQNVGEGIWKLLFVPWLKFVTSERNSTSKHLKFNIDESSGKDSQQFWHLELIEVDAKDVDGLTFILDTCRQLKSTMLDLSTKFFGLSVDDSRRLIDLCVTASKIFNMEMAKSLLEGCFLPNLPDALTSPDDNTVECREDDISKFILATNGAISPLVSTAQELGYFQRESVDCLTEFLKSLGRLTIQRQDQAYVQALMRILERDANFATLEKVGGGKREQGGADVGKENSISGLTESQLEEVELSKLFHNVHLEFPVCHISKSVILLLKQVDQIIKDADCCDKDHLPTVLRRIPHLIHLYSHCVPTLHAERMKNDLRFVAIYHNDCMYLAHQCLTLGRRKIYPLVESIGSEESDLRTLASISTLHLVSPLRNSATSTLLTHLRDRKAQLGDLFNSCRGLKDCAGKGSEACEKAILGCVSLLLFVFNSLNLLPVTVYLRIMGVLSDEFARLLCDAVVGLEDITTVECSTLLRLINSAIQSITRMFEKHLDAAFDPTLGGALAKNCEKSVNVLLERRIPSWPRLVSLHAVLAAASLEEIRFLAIPRSSTSTISLRLSTDEVRRLVRALFRPSAARSALLRDLAGGGSDASGDVSR
uniref:Zw10 protein n=1 Tax=Echinococcus granulosus TaxID=6210 RepID=A0A068X3U2_ECHGR|nr:zw10 protein [Echinococcus granulosus]